MAMTTLNPSSLRTRIRQSAPRLLAYSFYVAGVIAALTAAAILISSQS